ncbi:OLC1v1035618C1 [Oldenlandia corymbosa var. corymbosa]|uniref:OLC1v1035618C1 n=1 Tax=Oldenlandia corymbosa var. corymbosa TaxID=529605 RepID=A0AAV1CVY4_OLDCO|nr:OLC1v1035618C1 [Oldenlandia corymbosa var. corymbosa]
MNRKLAEFVNNQGQWRWELFTPYLPDGVWQYIGNIPPPQSLTDQDIPLWRASASGKFSTKSAYNHLYSNKWDQDDRKWQLLWKWQGPERIKLFMWLLMRKALLCNAERLRRHMTDNGNCHLTIFHGQHGLLQHVGSCGEQRMKKYSLIQTHKDAISNPECRRQSRRSHGATRGLPRNMVLVSWIPPQNGWTRLNIDGAVDQAQRRAATGGVLRDHHGNWLAGFAANIAYCTPVEAELQSAYHGLLLARKASLKSNLRWIILRLSN